VTIRDDPDVIVSLHVATGAAAGALTRSRGASLLLGPLLHVAADRIPHDDVGDVRFETYSGLALLALLGVGRGWLEPAVLGGAAAAAPDLEHVFPSLRPGGRKLFHHGEPDGGGVSTGLQLLVAGAIVGYLIGWRKA
jgi:hypothetical protein